MAGEAKRPLKVFLCHASGDKPQVRVLYKRLVAEGVDVWLDQDKLLPGQDWRVEIPRAVRAADVVVVCLSNNSITKEGYIQKEIKFALDVADEKPDGAIFLIPARLEDCPVPEKLSRWQWVDLFEENGHERLTRSLQSRADEVGVGFGDQIAEISLDDRLDQLYTDALAAFYIEDWDKAYQRFQAFLRERPNDKQAVEKFERSKRQRRLKSLYDQGIEAHNSENWQIAVDVFEKVINEEAGYKDASAQLRHAKNKVELTRLYDEARRLHKAEQWQAVLKVFSQITVIDSNYPDPDGLKSSANKKVADSARFLELNEIYKRALREMESDNWQEAYKLLRKIKKVQVGFLETEQLLLKIEEEIKKVQKDGQEKIIKLRQWSVIFVAVVIVGVLIWRWGLPIRFTLDTNRQVYIYPEPGDEPNRILVTLNKNETYYLCKYDADSKRYLIARVFWDCKSDNALGWIAAIHVPNNLINKLVIK